MNIKYFGSMEGKMKRSILLSLAVFILIINPSLGLSAETPDAGRSTLDGCDLFPTNCVTDGEDCGEDINGGCSMPVPFFTPIACGDSMCGTIWAEDWNHDTDWFELILTEQTLITLTGAAEFPLLFGFGDSSDCWGMSGLDPFAQSDVPCSLMTVSRIAGPGKYWIYVSSVEFNGYPCGVSNNYWITIDCEIENCDCEPGEVNGMVPVNIFDVTYLVSYLYKGGPAPVPYEICSGDANGDCLVNIFDITGLIVHLYSGGPISECNSWKSTCGTPLR
jgi:hypothetical protein